MGTILAQKFNQQGFEINCLISRTKASAEKLADLLHVKTFGTETSLIPDNTNLIFIVTPDRVIEEIAGQLAKERLFFHQLAIAHFSGALTTDVFDPLIQKGVVALSMHPFQTFSSANDSKTLSQDIFDCYFGLQASDTEGFDLGKQLIYKLGGKVMYVPKESKTLYHIGAVLVSNYTVTLTHLGAEIFSSLGLSQKDAFQVFEPIMLQTFENLKSSEYIHQVLTGPVERGDAKILKQHLSELKTQMPHLIPAYATFAMETVRVAIQKGSLDPTQASELLHLLENTLIEESKTPLP